MEKLTRYEVLMLAVPEITQDESKELEKQLDRIIQAGGGSTISFERWGKYHLAHPVRKNEYGVYFLSRFQSPKNKQLMEEVKSLFAIRFETIVMRALISCLDSSVSLEYQRPRSLEEAPVREEGFGRDRRPRPYSSATELDETLVDQESNDEDTEETERNS